MRDEYRGPSDKDGHSLFDGGEPYGSELAWLGWLVMPASDSGAPADTYAAQIGLNYLNDMAFLRKPQGGYTLDSVPFTLEAHNALKQLGESTTPQTRTSPDSGRTAARSSSITPGRIRRFPPFASIDYYRAVVRASGGLQAARSFSRLYMIPGLYHCPCGQPVDGDPATTVQFMPQLVSWVERGEAPQDVTLPVTAQSVGAHLSFMTVAPFDPLQPAPANDGLNSNYAYIGQTSDYPPDNALWCPENRQPLSCSAH